MSVLNGPCPHRLNHLRLTLLLAAAIAAGEFRCPDNPKRRERTRPACQASRRRPPPRRSRCGTPRRAGSSSARRSCPGSSTTRGWPALVAQQFDCLTAENEFKPRSLQPQPGKFNFAAADRIVEFARRHGMKVVGHTLCWHSQSPAWMFRGPDGKPLPRDEALRNLKDHIDAVVGHFKGKVVGWDVVNEAISDAKDEYLRDTPARRAIGDDYIVKAFEFAHAADPDAELYYNDYGNENPGKREKTIRLIRELKARGVRLDAVGIQCPPAAG